eukprot:TRINITY_DN3568_c1_g1_i1.p1 TRINITY_DN3568_c1_g1~~TRINITY_DN3568_c1_g1_i1.p1  ORF type:complete len:150 (-),score=7.09 TRINITY_DN3568_c1_g1_i1:240-689(-)
MKKKNTTIIYIPLPLLVPLLHHCNQNRTELIVILPDVIDPIHTLYIILFVFQIFFLFSSPPLSMSKYIFLLPFSIIPHGIHVGDGSRPCLRFYSFTHSSCLFTVFGVARDSSQHNHFTICSSINVFKQRRRKRKKKKNRVARHEYTPNI